MPSRTAQSGILAGGHEFQDLRTAHQTCALYRGGLFHLVEVSNDGSSQSPSGLRVLANVQQIGRADSQTEAVASAWPHAHQSKAEEAPSLASQQSSNSIYRACYLLGILV
jgi:uncharacterized protein YgiB involved in biofilm formation